MTHLQLSLQFRLYMRLKSWTLFKSLTLNIYQIDLVPWETDLGGKEAGYCGVSSGSTSVGRKCAG